MKVLPFLLDRRSDVSTSLTIEVPQNKWKKNEKVSKNCNSASKKHQH